MSIKRMMERRRSMKSPFISIKNASEHLLKIEVTWHIDFGSGQDEPYLPKLRNSNLSESMTSFFYSGQQNNLDSLGIIHHHIYS